MREPDEIYEDFHDLTLEGKMEVVGENENGEQLYRLTADGRLHVEKMLDVALEEAAQKFSRELDIPEFMARDLLIRHASRMKEADA